MLGGGVLQRKTLVNKIRISLRKQLGGYVRHDFVERADGGARLPEIKGRR